MHAKICMHLQMQHAGIIPLLLSDIPVSKNTHPQPLPTNYHLKKRIHLIFLINQMYTLTQSSKNA